MTAWNESDLPLNKLYNVQKGYEDNAILTEYESGRVVATQRNTRNRRVYSMSYAATRAQEQAFFNWYENELGGNAGTFTAPSLRGDGTTQEYRFTGTPTTSGLNIIEINMEWVEV